jgi:hypothetical protein
MAFRGPHHGGKIFRISLRRDVGFGEAHRFHLIRFPARLARTMLDNAYTTFRQYMAFYGKYISQQWNDIGPVGYGVLLVSIGFFGWVLMKSSVKGPG